MKAGIPRFIRHFLRVADDSRLRYAKTISGVLALLWFLVRVIPKPSRASYPCQRAAFPVASAFVVWLCGALAIKCGLKRLAHGRLAAYCGMMTVVAFAAWTLVSFSGDGTAETATNSPSGFDFVAATPNTPVGVARGIHPGRVVSAHDPLTTKWTGNWQQKSDQWWLDQNTDQARVDVLLAATLTELTGAKSCEEAWRTIFEHYNRQSRQLDQRGYRPGEVVAVKINLNNSSGAAKTDNWIDAGPQTVLAMVRQLVNEAHVQQKDILVYDARKYIPPYMLAKVWKEFSGVRFLQENGPAQEQPKPSLSADYPRLEAADWFQGITYSNGKYNEARLIPRQIANATYLINLAILKGHSYPYNEMDGGDSGQTGITMCGKNHFGSIKGTWELHSNINPTQEAKLHTYSPIVDLAACPNLGGKTILFVLDGLYCGRKWQSYPQHFPNPPFNNRVEPYENPDWPASILASLDGVALDSVGLDLLLAQTKNNTDSHGHPRILIRENADDYLFEMAQADHPQSGVVYKQGGKVVTSLGVHEHWDNDETKQYSRNLDPENGKGIELIYLPPEKLPAPAKTARPETAIATVPAAQTPTSVTSKGTPASGDLPKAGLEAWFSAGRVEQTDGTITQILDLSGNANHARREPPTAAPASNPALAEDAASGQPVLRFTGANIAFAFKRLTDIRTAFWVVSKDPASFGKRSEKFVLGDRNSNDFHAGWTSDTIFNTNVNPGHLSKFLKDGKTWLSGQSMDATKTPFPSQLSLISTVSAGPVRAGQLAQDRNFSGRSWQGEIAEILLYNVELSEADRQAVEKYLIAKYKIKPGIKPDTAVHPMAPAVLPGKGPAQHPFLYAGEWDTRKPQEQSMFIVRGGKVVWQYAMPLRTPSGGIQEFDDATLLSDGNIVFSRMSGAGMVSPDKKLVWEYPAPAGTEIHSCQPIGKDRVLIMRNGNLAQAMIINTATGKIEKEIRIPTTVKGTHGQFRHIRMTKAGTILVPHMSEGKVVEYDLDGKEVWSVKTRSPWSAVRLNSGNTLIAGDASKYVREVNPKGETVWELTQADVPDIKLFNTQTANRLANGNTVVCNWCAGNNRTQEWAGTVQIFEVTSDKKVVWALSSWKDPDLGPSTSIQLLDEPGAREDQER